MGSSELRLKMKTSELSNPPSDFYAQWGPFLKAKNSELIWSLHFKATNLKMLKNAKIPHDPGLILWMDTVLGRYPQVKNTIYFWSKP
jgi:hypothetical protein